MAFSNYIKLKLKSLQDYVLMVGDIFKKLIHTHRYVDDIVREMYLIGAQAFLLVFCGGLFVGIILAIEVGHHLETFGAVTIIGRAVSLGMIRELGPVITGLLLAARTGAKNTSEIGAMVLSEQVDALRAFGTNPIAKLTVPRVVAALLMFPPLTMIADAAGLTGGLFISTSNFNVDMSFYWDSALSSLLLKDLFVGSVKPIFFGFFVATISCYYGMTTKEGTAGLGRNTVNAVVMSSMIILVLDFIFTKVVWEIM